ncbi:glycoside hydrolase family 6 protein [Nocardioides sp. DS6]|uniref:Glucanase n=1 Tax=Nocardioides eburneus TaxID=3231482 RepID=A0ABV3T2H8_9ACTN
MPHPLRILPSRRALGAVLTALAIGAAAFAAAGVGAEAAGTTAVPAPKKITGAAYAQNRTNPLVGGTWAVNNGFWDNQYNRNVLYHWQHATGSTRTYLGRIATQPTALWFTANNSNPATRPTVVRDYIRQLQNGDTNSLVQMALFGMFAVQGGEKNKTKALTSAQVATYKAWITGVSKEIGSSRVAIIMEPDQALLFNRPGKPKSMWTGGTATRMKLVAWATKYIHDHNHRATVYLDAGDADWLNADQAAYLLAHTGVSYARGFALGATHYSATSADISHGAAIVAALAAKGVKGTHFVIDTADNGRPFTMDQFYARHPKSKGGFFDNSANCRSMTDTVCNALGIRPTWRVADAGTGQTWALRTVARTYLDGYLWFGRPWLKDQASPFVLSKAVAAAKYSPFQR